MRDIGHSSVDLVHSSWIEEEDKVDKDEKDEKADEDNEDINIVPYGRIVTTPVTIWVGHDIFDVEVAYRKSVVRTFGGPELFAPVSDLDPLKAVINPVTTALGPPIAGLKSLKSQGTMCFSFRVSEDLYAVTTRHVLFPDDEGNDPYTYIGTFFSLSR